MIKLFELRIGGELLLYFHLQILSFFDDNIHRNYRLLFNVMMMINCFCGMVDRRKAFSIISSRYYCQRFSPLQISDTPRAGFENMGKYSSYVQFKCRLSVAFLKLVNSLKLICVINTFMRIFKNIKTDIFQDSNEELPSVLLNGISRKLTVKLLVTNA